MTNLTKTKTDYLKTFNITNKLKLILKDNLKMTNNQNVNTLQIRNTPTTEE